MLVAKSSPLPATGVVVDFVIVSCVPVPPGLVSWWPAGGNALDASTNHNDGTLNGGAAFDSGMVGQAFSFDGENGYVQVPDALSLNPTNAITIDAWINLNDRGNDNNMIIRKDGECDNRQYLMTVTYTGVIRGHVGLTNGNYYWVDGNTPINPGTWYHVAMTYDGSDLRVYVNGQLDASGSLGGPMLATTEPVLLGLTPPDQYCDWYSFPGFIDEPDIFNRALSAGEIQAIYNAGAAGKCNPNCVTPSTNAVGWWAGDGNPYDLAHTNFGILHGGANYAPGAVGQGFLLNGTNAYIEIPDAPDLKPANVSVEAWVRFDAAETPGSGSPGQEWILFKKNSRSGNFEGYSLLKDRIYNQNYNLIDVFSFVVTSSGGDQRQTYSTTQVAVGAWYHVAGTCNSAGGAVSLYVNGVKEATNTANFPLDYGTRPVFIGTTGEWWDGKLCGIVDEATVYNRALTATEVSALYSAGCAGKCKVDSDHDGLTDLQEAFLGTDPTKWSTRGDGISDGDAFLQGRNLFVPGAVPDTNGIINLQVYTPLK